MPFPQIKNACQLIFKLALMLGSVCSFAGNTTVPAAPEDMLPDSTVTNGDRDIQAAWLVAPTTRYRHAVLGDNLEAAGLEVLLASGERLRQMLVVDVFEDLIPRLSDVDNDGRDEIILVRSNSQTGARISVWGVRDGKLAELATGPVIGRGNRWLNPVGAADFDGDGKIEIAYVQTPHIGGILRILEYRKGSMSEEYRAKGFSNHEIGDTDLSSMHEIADYNGDGISDLKIRDFNSSRYRIMTIKNGALLEWRP